MRAIDMLKAKWEKDILSAFLGLIAIMKSIDVNEIPFKESKLDKNIFKFNYKLNYPLSVY
jgi:hypothetical protein